MVDRNYKEDHYTLLRTKYESSGPCGFGEEDFFIMFSHDAPGAWPVWTPGARLAGFIKRAFIHCYSQNRKALVLVVLEKKVFLCFSHCKSMGANDPPGGSILGPGAWLAGFIKRITTHCYTQNMKDLGLAFSEKTIFYVFPMTSSGRGLYGPQGHGWQDL